MAGVPICQGRSAYRQVLRLRTGADFRRGMTRRCLTFIGCYVEDCNAPSRWDDEIAVAFNTVEGWSRDVTADIASELRQRDNELGEMPDSILDFMDANRR